MTNALYRAIVGVTVPLRKSGDIPTPYRQANMPQTNVNGPVVEPNEVVTPPIVNTPTNPIS